MTEKPNQQSRRGALNGVSMVVGLLCAASNAAAEPGLADEADSPIVTAGATELSLRSGELVGRADSHDWQTRAEASYGYLSWWRPGLAATFQREGDDVRLSGLGVESIVDFIPTRQWPVHFGAYAEHERNMREGPDHFELKLLMQRTRGPWTCALTL